MKKATIDSKVTLSGVTFFDLLLIFFLLALSAGVIAWRGFSNICQDASENTAVIYCNGEEVERMPLGENLECDLLEKQMGVLVKDGKIRITHSDCPENICVHAGWIRLTGETLTCVPNRIVVEIIADTDPVVDAVVY